MALHSIQIGRASASVVASFLVATPVVLSSNIAPAQAHGTHNHADETEYYIGLDGLRVLTGGMYAGLENPNYNRLTFLFAHREEDFTTNHFHGIGVYSYSGLLDSPTINPSNTNNRIPETYTGQLPLQLLPGKGAFSGRLVNTATGEEYSNIKIESIATLATATDEDDQYLFNSSGGRWQSSLTGATIGLQLLEISSGLNIADETGVNIFNSVGDIYTIGTGDDFTFKPKFWTDAAATLGKYSATFKLVDISTNSSRTPLLESGTFSFDFRVEQVPEPSTTVSLGLLGLLGFSLSQLKKRTVKNLK
ncbi:all3515 family Zur-repressed PEP-CTERM protein [Anabaena subtropica]|uniref:PEP-CTERM sorting domain-containing protein n=1 Tax=Anabaena subtropica FACHB-260 TaxID=2692884 RepID=A0ABR8CSI4_9NOST|nr:all3515 family Zur-repressed PEP-CTERM protein [Anabaena subtropica]MBD2345132.1 PEP-CTERM sorting domain-containing protein [Anabaena subtropica FACHB-260]